MSEFLKAHKEAHPERAAPLFWDGIADRPEAGKLQAFGTAERR